MVVKSSFKLETKKVRGLIAEEKQPFSPKEGSGSHKFQFFRLPKIKPFKSKAPAPQTTDLPSINILNIEKEERKPDVKGWGLAAVHAHQCCASQKHPAFVHLQLLLQKESKLTGERVKQWQFKEYLIVARKLEAFVKEQIEKPLQPEKKHTISIYDDSSPASEKPPEENPWEEYNNSLPTRLFELPGTFK